MVWNELCLARPSKTIEEMEEVVTAIGKKERAVANGKWPRTRE